MTGGRTDEMAALLERLLDDRAQRSLFCRETDRQTVSRTLRPVVPLSLRGDGGS